MRTLGLLGGATWRASAAYYAGLNAGVEAALGPRRSAKLVLHSIDYGALREARAQGRWRAFSRTLVGACVGLKRAGAEALVLCSNTLHALVEPIEAETGLPVLHVCDAVAAEVTGEVGLLGTAYTVTEGFYRARLEAHGLTVRVSDAATVAELDRILLEEVAADVHRDASRARFLDAITALGTPSVVFGCTEIGQLVRPEQVAVRVVDALDAHVRLAVRWLVDADG